MRRGFGRRVKPAQVIPGWCEVLIECRTIEWIKGQSTNSTASSFSALADTVTRPTGSATRTIIDLSQSAGMAGVRARNTLAVVPYGGNDNNDIINVKVSVWNRFKERVTNGVADLWTARLVCEVQCTLSSSLVGVAGQHVVATELYADTLTLTTGIAVLHNGTADVDKAWFECDVAGNDLVEITGDLGTGGDTMNWYYGWIN